jgi:hypothetical protein
MIRERIQVRGENLSAPFVILEARLAAFNNEMLNLITP